MPIIFDCDHPLFTFLPYTASFQCCIASTFLFCFLPPAFESCASGHALCGVNVCHRRHRFFTPITGKLWPTCVVVVVEVKSRFGPKAVVAVAAACAVVEAAEQER